MTAERPARGRLFWRLYLWGLLLLLVTTAAGMLGAKLVSDGRPWRDHPQRVRASVEAHQGDPAALQAHLDELHALLDVRLAVYDRAGRLLASAGDAPPGPPSTEVLAELDADGHDVARDGWMVTMSMQLDAPDGGPGRVLRLGHDTSQGAAKLGAGLLLVLVTAAGVLWLLARRIARPLEQISDAAERLGRGQLDARTGIERSDEIGALAAAFDRMAGRLERLVRGERELLANVSHELRTPLARMQVALELCEESVSVDTMHRHLAGIGQDIAELDRLVEDVLVTARLDSAEPGALILRREPVVMAELVADAERRFAERHPALELRIELADDVPPREADPVLLRRVVDNLLDNAARYGTGALDEPLELAVRQAGAATEITVRDHGAGLDEADLERVFEPFFRADRSRSDDGGVGLGLTMCRRIVEAHGGTLTLEDARPGVRARVRLPAGASVS